MRGEGRLLRSLVGRRALAAVALAVLLQAPLRAQIVDCVVAVVNGLPITLVDLRIAGRFGLSGRPNGNASPSAILDDLIGRKLVISLAREQTPIDEAEIDGAMNDLSARLGPEALAGGLKEFGLEASDLRTTLEETILYEKIIAARFGQAAPVTLGEIETYYRDVYSPAEKQAGREPAPMVQVLGVIEARLHDLKKASGIEAWTKSLKAQADIRINKDCLE
jgi:hypothetical protein